MLTAETLVFCEVFMPGEYHEHALGYLKQINFENKVVVQDDSFYT